MGLWESLGSVSGLTVTRWGPAEEQESFLPWLCFWTARKVGSTKMGRDLEGDTQGSVGGVTDNTFGTKEARLSSAWASS